MATDSPENQDFRPNGPMVNQPAASEAPPRVNAHPNLARPEKATRVFIPRERAREKPQITDHADTETKESLSAYLAYSALIE